MPTCCRVSAPAPCGCAPSTGRRSSWSACDPPRFCAGRARLCTSRASSGWPRPRNAFASPETGGGVPATDEIYEKYLQKAIVEINDLAQEVAQAGGARVPVLGSGHPLADVMLLKHHPQPAEVQEGVAFYGRAGQAILKSLQRLRVDPMAVYGTNCLKFADGDEEEARPWLTRELHIVQPKLGVAMGEQAPGFRNGRECPLRRAVAGPP